MKRFMILALAVIMFSACKKDDQHASPCAKKLKSHFQKELRCGEKGSDETNLYKGTYKSETVYFMNTMCIYCLVASPKDGFNCDMEKIVFDDFRDVTDITEVYNSCTNKYSE